MYFSIAYKMLLRQKKKFSGIILMYLILITAVVSIGVFDNIENLRSVEMAREIQGDYNYILKYDNDVDLKDLKSQKFIDKLGFLKYIDSSKYGYKYNMNIMNYDESYISMENSKIISGRAPKNRDEILVERWVSSILGGNVVGKEITIPLYKDGKNHTYKIVGVLSDISSNASDGMIYVYSGGEAPISSGDSIFIKSIGRKNANILSEYINSKYPNVKGEKPRSSERILNKLYKEDNTLKFLGMAVAYAVVLMMFQYVISIVNAREDLYNYGIIKAIGIKKKGILYMKISEQIVAFLPSIIFTLAVIQPIVNRIVNSASGESSNIAINGNIEPTKMFCLLIFSLLPILITSIMAERRYSKKENNIIDDTRSLAENKKINKEKRTRAYKFKRIENKLLFSFLSGYSRKMMFISAVIAISSSLYILMDYRGNEIEYSSSSMYERMYGGMSESISSPVLGSMYDGISGSDIERLGRIKLPGNKSLSDRISATKESYARLDLSDSRISNMKFFEDINKNDTYTKEVLKGLLTKDKDHYSLKITVFGVDKNKEKMIKKATGKSLEKGKAILFVPKAGGSQVLDIKSGDSIKLHYPKDGVVDVNYISGKDVTLSDVNVDISDIISSKVVDTDFYVSGDYPSLIVDEDTFTRLFGIENYRSIGIYLSDEEQNLVESDISKTLSNYNGLTISNYTQQRMQMEKSNKITSMISKFVSLFFLAIGVVNLFSVTISEYLQRKDYFDTLMCIGMEKRSVKNMIFKQAAILSVPIAAFTVLVSFIGQSIYYKKSVMYWTMNPRFAVYSGSYIEMLALVVLVSVLTSICAYRIIVKDR